MALSRRSWGLRSLSSGSDCSYGALGQMAKALGAKLQPLVRPSSDPLVEAKMKPVIEGVPIGCEALHPALKAMDDGMSPFMYVICKSGSVGLYTNEQFSDKFLSTEEACEEIRDRNVVTEYLWARLVSPKCLYEFYEAFADLVFGLEDRVGEIALVLSVRGRAEQEFPGLIRLRHVVSNDGEYTSTMVSIIPLSTTSPYIKPCQVDEPIDCGIDDGSCGGEDKKGIKSSVVVVKDEEKKAVPVVLPPPECCGMCLDAPDTPPMQQQRLLAPAACVPITPASSPAYIPQCSYTSSSDKRARRSKDFSYNASSIVITTTTTIYKAPPSTSCCQPPMPSPSLLLPVVAAHLPQSKKALVSDSSDFSGCTSDSDTACSSSSSSTSFDGVVGEKEADDNDLQMVLEQLAQDMESC